MRMVVIHCKGTEQAQTRGYLQRSGPWEWQLAEEPGAAWFSQFSVSLLSFIQQILECLPSWCMTLNQTGNSPFCEVDQSTCFSLLHFLDRKKNPVSFFNVINNEVGFFPSAAVWWHYLCFPRSSLINMEGWKLLLPRAFQPSSSPSPSTVKRRMRWVLEVALRSQSSVKCGLGLPASVSHEKCRFLNSTQRFELAGAQKFALLQHWKLRLIVLFEFFLPQKYFNITTYYLHIYSPLENISWNHNLYYR